MSRDSPSPVLHDTIGPMCTPTSQFTDTRCDAKNAWTPAEYRKGYTHYRYIYVRSVGAMSAGASRKPRVINLRNGYLTAEWSSPPRVTTEATERRPQSSSVLLIFTHLYLFTYSIYRCSQVTGEPATVEHQAFA